MQAQNIILQKPSINYRDAYQDLLQEYHNSEEAFIPWVLQLNPDPFEQLIETLLNQEKGIGLPEGYVPGSTFWLVEDEQKILGVINIRHYLTDGLRRIGGHIGYEVQPSERKKGYATLMLRLALEEAKKLGIEKAFLTCNTTNIASAKVMLNNGAVLDSEERIDGRETQHYWISIL